MCFTEMFGALFFLYTRFIKIVFIFFFMMNDLSPFVTNLACNVCKYNYSKTDLYINEQCINKMHQSVVYVVMT